MTTAIYSEAPVQPIHTGWLALVLEAAASHALAGTGTHPVWEGLRYGTLQLVWQHPDLLRFIPGTDNLEWLCDAMREQAKQYGREGLHVSSSDCWWLVAKLAAGEIRLVTADLLAAVPVRAVAS